MKTKKLTSRTSPKIANRLNRVEGIRKHFRSIFKTGKIIVDVESDVETIYVYIEDFVFMYVVDTREANYLFESRDPDTSLSMDVHFPKGA